MKCSQQHTHNRITQKHPLNGKATNAHVNVNTSLLNLPRVNVAEEMRDKTPTVKIGEARYGRINSFIFAFKYIYPEHYICS